MTHLPFHTTLSRAIPRIGRILEERNVRRLAGKAREGHPDAVQRLIELSRGNLEKNCQKIIHDALSSLSQSSAIDAFCQSILQDENSFLEEIARNHEYVPSDEELRPLYLVCIDRWDIPGLPEERSSYAIFREAFMRAPGPVKKRVCEKMRKGGWTHLLYYDLIINPIESTHPDLRIQDWDALIDVLEDGDRNSDLWSLLFCVPPSQAFRILEGLQKRKWIPSSPTDRLRWNYLLRRLHPISTFRAPAVNLWRESPFGDITILSELKGRNLLATGNEQGYVAYWSTSDGAFLTSVLLHTDRVNCLASSSHGSLLASGDQKGRVQLSQYPDNAILGTWSCTGGVRFLRFTQDDHYLLSVDEYGIVIVWDIQTHDIRETFDTKQGKLSWVEIAHNKELSRYYLVTGSEDEIRLFEIPCGTLRASLTHRNKRSTSYHLGQDESILFVGYSDSTIRLYKVPDLSSDIVLRGHKADVTALNDVCGGGTILASGSADGMICLWDLPAGSLRTTIRTHTGAIYQLKGLIGVPKLLSGSDDGTVRIWQVPEGSPSGTIQDPTHRVISFTISFDESVLVTQGTNHNIRLWSLVDSRPYGTLWNLPETVSALALHPDGDQLVSSGENRILYLRSLEDGHLIRTIPMDTGKIASLAFLPEGRLASGGDDRMIHLWDLRTGDRLTTLQGSKGSIFALAVDPAGTRIAGAGWDEIVRIWNPSDGSLFAEMKGHSSLIRTLCFSPDGKTLASAGNDGNLILWNAHTGEQLFRFRGHRGVISSLSFTPDGHFLISGGWDGTVCIWNPQTGTLCRELDETAKKITHVTVAPDGTIAGTGHQDGTIRFWSLYDGTMVLTLLGHTGAVVTLACTEDRVVSGGEDGLVKAWSLPWAKPLSLATPQDLGSIQALSPNILPGVDAEHSRTFLEALVRGKVYYDIEIESITYPQGEYDIEIGSEWLP